MAGIKHKVYTQIVKEELEAFLGRTAIRDITLQQAENFLQHLNNLPSNHSVSQFNNAVRQEMKAALEAAAQKAATRSLVRLEAAGAKKEGRKLVKGIPVIEAVVAAYLILDDANAYGTTPAVINGVIDTIPLVGTGKILAETFHGYRFLDVAIGPVEFQASEVRLEDR